MIIEIAIGYISLHVFINVVTGTILYSLDNLFKSYFKKIKKSLK